MIETTSGGNVHRGAMLPNGMLSMCPLNVDKSRLHSTNYEYEQDSVFGCSNYGGFLFLLFTGEVDFINYGSPYSGEEAQPGYYPEKKGKLMIDLSRNVLPTNADYKIEN